MQSINVLMLSGPERDEQGKQSMILNDFFLRLLHSFDVLSVMLLDSRGKQVQREHLHGLRLHGP